MLHILTSIWCFQCFRFRPFYDREAWRAAIHGVAKSWTRLSNRTKLKNYISHCLNLPLLSDIWPGGLFFHGESHGQSSLEGYSSWGCKESDITEVYTYTMVYDIDFFTCLFAICMCICVCVYVCVCVCVNSLFRSFACFLLDVCFLLFNFKSFLYNLDTSALSDIYFGNIFSQILTSLFLTVFCTVEVLNFDIYSSYPFFLSQLCFWLI